MIFKIKFSYNKTEDKQEDSENWYFKC